MTLWEWLEDQREQALTLRDRNHPQRGAWKFWDGYAAALQDVQNYVV